MTYDLLILSNKGNYNKRSAINFSHLGLPLLASFLFLINDKFKAGGLYAAQTDLPTLCETVRPGYTSTHWTTLSLNAEGPWYVCF